jgi:CheY-like chemotaxis protein
MSVIRVVVIDDEKLIAEACAAILRRAGCNVSVAHSGEEGLGFIREQLPDVVVCDIRMPGIDGFQVARELKAQPATARIPVVLMSGHGFAEPNSCDAFLAKPFRVPELIALVQRLAERGEVPSSQ